jgi:hypothetical protein
MVSTINMKDFPGDPFTIVTEQESTCATDLIVADIAA